jgi:hypothetical protein
MACFGPIKGYYSSEVNASGKRSIVFDQRKAFSPTPITLPCGNCPGCKMERCRQWAMRCMHEARMHRSNYFVTLTYDNANLPDLGFLVKRDMVLFMKRLRNFKGAGVRFYGCGEYGELNKRPHYHILLFNVEFEDRKFHSLGKRKGEFYYSSPVLTDIWSKGAVLLGDVTFDSACYVAGYIHKKVTGKAADDHYSVYDADGRIHVRPPEFTNMSRNPGIGTGWYRANRDTTYAHDSVVVNRKLVRPPRFYDTLFADEFVGPTRAFDKTPLERIKRRRRVLAAILKADNSSRRRRVKEICLLMKLQRRKL